MSRRFDQADNIRAFVNTLARLAEAGHALPPLLTISEMSKAYTANAKDRQDFAPLFAEFRLAHGAIAAQHIVFYWCAMNIVYWLIYYNL